ncbi:unnamed protein product [Parascedosporium putredinis]|uniref:Carbohydrate kinase PfkB domain-containing protein n=1 Tax=Parascedosporium putredinis TaxID=1442378 RepID=A0A9P1M6M5_9PEZI|nr:unnamed protein product [Parascedosporium putredinis]CAI7987296.1 unnamed protein product [Parascedosporium putredinis]
MSIHHAGGDAVEGKTSLPFCTIGAGDTFIAGMLYALTCHSADWDTKTKLEFAVELATLKVQREGFEGLGQDVQRWL